MHNLQRDKIMKTKNSQLILSGQMGSLKGSCEVRKRSLKKSNRLWINQKGITDQKNKYSTSLRKTSTPLSLRKEENSKR